MTTIHYQINNNWFLLLLPKIRVFFYSLLFLRVLITKVDTPLPQGRVAGQPGARGRVAVRVGGAARCGARVGVASVAGTPPAPRPLAAAPAGPAPTAAPRPSSSAAFGLRAAGWRLGTLRTPGRLKESLDVVFLKPTPRQRR